MKNFIYSLIVLISCCQAKLQVVTSFSILENVVHEIGQDKVDIKNIVGRNQDAHSFEPTPQTSLLISGADVIFINGLNFESWFEKLIKAANYKNLVVNLSSNIKALCSHKSKKHNCVCDPHVWMNVNNVIIWVQDITLSLSKLDPSNASFYQNNATRYIKELTKLHDSISSKSSQFKKRAVKVITAHDAFNYFENAYGLIFLAPQGLSPQDEPSARELTAIITLIRCEKIPAIFVENVTSTHVIKQIAEEAHIKVGGILYSDALSLVSEPASTYVDLMRYNTQTIFNSLQ